MALDAEARHAMALVCKNAPGRMARRYALNDTVCTAFISAGIPASKEPAAAHGMVKGQMVFP